MIQRIHLRRQHQEGMTLLEVMIAAGIFAMAFVFLLGSLVSISATGASSENQTIAQSYLGGVLEEVRTLTYDQLLAYQPSALPDLGAGETVQVLCIAADGSEVQLPTGPGTLTTPLPNPVEVRVTLSWVDKMRRPYAARTSTLVRR